MPWRERWNDDGLLEPEASSLLSPVFFPSLASEERSRRYSLAGRRGRGLIASPVSSVLHKGGREFRSTVSHLSS